MYTFKDPEILCIFYKTLYKHSLKLILLFSGNYGSKRKRRLKVEESFEILKIIGLNKIYNYLKNMVDRNISI